ncbi:MAG: radical SAM protein [Candidatus Omnitrophica bacterium]|nr:radical SAM protein [Candidatus Omnitrophota bacterium]
MEARNFFSYLGAFLKAKFFGIKTPLLIGWDLTYKCNCDCKYCGLAKQNSFELSTDRALSLVDDLAQQGARRIHFGGGEPLLREDIDIILQRCKEKSIFTSVLTNGLLFKEKIFKLRDARLIKISLDGPEEINDCLRQKGSYKAALDTIGLAKKNGLKIAINTTLSDYNLKYIDFILNTADSYGVPVKFQPVSTLLSRNRDISLLLCKNPEYTQAIQKLIRIKKSKKGSRIINSLAGLRYLIGQGKISGFKCCAGLIYVRIAPDGSLYPCSKRMSEMFTCTEEFRDAMSKIQSLTCKECLCTSTLELNLGYSLKISAIKDIMRHF